MNESLHFSFNQTMELLPESIKDALSNLTYDQREEIDIIESIISINERNKREIQRKVFDFIEKRKIDSCLNAIYNFIEYAELIRPKEIESLDFLVKSIFDHFKKKSENLSNGSESKYITAKRHNFTERETLERVIFEDDVETLQRLIATKTKKEISEMMINGDSFFNKYINRYNTKLNVLDAAALYGSIKCFKYLLLNGNANNDNTCKCAIAGGNFEIVHFCEQGKLLFEDCLEISVSYHHFDLYEWLSTHFRFDAIPLESYINSYNEPLFYLTFSKGADVETRDVDGLSQLNLASKNGLLGVVKYLNEKHHAIIESKDKS